MSAKYERLCGLLREMESVLVAFSGGVDSTLLLRAARDVLGDRAVAATAVSPSLSGRELDETKRLAREIGVRQVLVETGELARPDYRANQGDRCYACKSELFERLEPIAEREGCRVIVYGEIADDATDTRPGIRAARERRIRAPLAEVGLTKAEIRAISRELGLPTWDKPAMACLASRLPVGTEVTAEKLGAVERAEAALVELGFRGARVRHHGNIARIEVEPGRMGRAFEHRAQIVEGVRAAGFRFVTLDLEGYRTGGADH